MTNVDLAIRMTADASDASAAAEQVGDSFKSMASEVDNAASKADAATSRIEGVAGAADTVDTKFGGATASLGALSGGLEAAGFEGAAGSLGVLGTATDFAAGAGQGLALVLETERGALIASKVAAVGKAVADKAMGAASKAAAVSQWALNAAMSANPIGLVVIAVAALVAGFVLAYQKSDTFRAIVDKAMSGARSAIGFVVGKVQDVIDKVDDVNGKFPLFSSAVGVAKDLIVGYFEAITLPIRTVVGLIQDVVSWLGKVDIPDGIGSIIGAVTRTSGRAGDTRADILGGGDAASAGVPLTLVNIELQTLDLRGTAFRDLVQALRREGVSLGGAVLSS